MKITLGEIANSVSVLETIKNQTNNFKIGYWIMRNMKILAESFNFFIMTREEIYSKYCDKVVSDQYPQGTYFTVMEDGSIEFNFKEDTNVSLFNKDMAELINMPCDDIQPYLLNINEIENMGDIRLSTDEISMIDYLLTE